MDYDEAETLTRYVWRYCPQLLTELERRVDTAGMAEIKASAAAARGHASQARIIKERWGIGQDVEVRKALADGYEAFRRRVAERLLADPAVLTAINRCPRCRRVVRTPLARQCLWCGHAWRGSTA